MVAETVSYHRNNHIAAWLTLKQWIKEYGCYDNQAEAAMIRVSVCVKILLTRFLFSCYGNVKIIGTFMATKQTRCQCYGNCQHDLNW